MRGWYSTDDIWALVLHVTASLLLVLGGLSLIDLTFRRRTWKRAGYGFWSRFVAWYGRPQWTWRSGPKLTQFDLDPEESEDLRSWFDPNELAECPKCGHTAALLSDGGALYCPACGVVSPSEAEWTPSPCPRCGMEAFPVSKSGVLYCPACGAVVQGSKP